MCVRQIAYINFAAHGFQRTENHMTNARLMQILLSVVGISIGQVLLKLAALHIREPGPGQERFGLYLINGYLFAGVTVLGCSTLLWTWILRWVPLNAAYPYMALAFVFVPLICFLLLGEPMSWKQLLGTVLIVAGVVVVSL
jgi:drug/metabolite transporter (DMT)-like permease